MNKIIFDKNCLNFNFPQMVNYLNLNLVELITKLVGFFFFFFFKSLAFISPKINLIAPTRNILFFTPKKYFVVVA